MPSTVKDPTSRPLKNSTSKRRSNGKAKQAGLAEGKAANVPIVTIEPSSFNPRVDFAPETLQELAKSIRQHGVLQPLVVRAHPDRQAGTYELVAGERRWRAAKLAGLTTAPVSVCSLSDREAREIAAVENLQRENLSPIEEARAYQSLLTGDDAPTQSALAERLGVSQGQISNRLRLLELPEAVQRHVISGEIPATHARELCRYKEHPVLLEKLVVEIVAQVKAEGLPPVDVFAEAVASDIVFQFGRRIAGLTWDRKTGRQVQHFKPTAEQRAQLQIIDVPDPCGRKDKTVEVALNRPLWDKLQAEHAAHTLAERAKGNGAKSKVKAKPKSKMTPAQRAAAEKAEAEKAKERAEQFARRLQAWKNDWQRWLIADAIPHLDDTELLRLLLTAAVSRWYVHLAGTSWDRRLNAWDLACSQEPDALARVALAGCFWSAEDGACQDVGRGQVEAIFRHLDLDLERAWLDDQAGPLSEAYWNLHTVDQLLDLGRELLKGKTDLGALPKKKTDLVALLLAQRPTPQQTEVGLDLPKELRGRKRARVKKVSPQ